MKKRLAEASPRLRARVAGSLYWLSVLMASFSEIVLRGPLKFAGGLIAVLGMVAMTLLFYGIFKPISSGVSMFAVSLSLVGLSFEALRWQPRGVNIAIVFSGFYCLIIGCLIFRSNFLPRILGALMIVAGLGWLTYLSKSLASSLFPYNLASGLLGEGLVMLWLLAIGLNAQKWNELVAAQRSQA